MDEPKTVDIVPAGKQTTDLVRAEDFMPLMSVEQAIGRKKQINEFIAGVMIEGEDYGKMPGDKRNDAKKVLLKPGAEKLSSIFGLTPQYVKETIIEDWTGRDHAGEPLFYYEYRCQLYRGGRFIGEAIGSANSWETKYRYRWMREEDVPLSYSKDDLENMPTKGGRRTLFEFTFAIDKAETTGNYGKPAEHWQMFRDAIEAGTARKAVRSTSKGDRPGFEIEVDQTLYRIPNPDVADTVNTLQKMAQKRALVAAVLVATNCSDAFTQDLEEAEPPAGAAAAGHEPVMEPGGDQAESRLPGPIRMVVEAIGKKGGATKEAFDLLKRGLIEALPVNGADEYQRILKKYEIKPEGGNKTNALRMAAIEMWEVAELAREATRKQNASAFHGSDDDLPAAMQERSDHEPQEQMTMEAL